MKKTPVVYRQKPQRPDWGGQSALELWDEEFHGDLSRVLSVFISDVGVGLGGDMVGVSGDTELLGKANGTKLQQDLGTLSDKMTEEILWSQMWKSDHKSDEPYRECS